MIIATAGHVDHGKTTLLHALTGTDADRLPEEKARGMTIDLGYAYWPQDDGRIIGFIDVPGHEKFLSNMLSGINGIDHALLVVACDDGVMPQTEEHLTLLSLLGCPALTVALTKSDRATPERIATVREQTLALTTRLGWASATCFTTSALQPDSLLPLASHLRALTPRAQPRDRRFRLAVDRIFTLKGAGLVVTGTCLSGEVALEETLWLTGASCPVRVRGLHSQNRPVSRAGTGERVALNLAGDISKEQIQRGDWLLAQRPPQAAERVIVALAGNAHFQMWQPVHIHHAASHVTGRISPLQPGLAELIPDQPLWLAEEDRVILRHISAQQTLAGARVVLLTPKKRGKRQPDYLHWLQQLANAHDARERIALQLATQPGSLTRIGWACQLTPDGLQTMLAPLEPMVTGDDVMLAAQATAWKQQVLNALAQFHEEYGDQPGPGLDRLRRIALADKPAALAQTLIRQLIAEGEIENQRGWLRLPGFELQLTQQEEALWQRISPLFSSEPWWVRDLAAEVNEPEAAMRLLLNKAAQAGYLTAVIRDRFYLNQQMDRFAALIRERCTSQGSTSAADFRDALGIGRKLAVQILEYFDRTGYTRRKGNHHLLRDEALFSR